MTEVKPTLSSVLRVLADHFFRRESAQRLPNIQDRVFVHWGDILAYNKSKEDD